MFDDFMSEIKKNSHKRKPGRHKPVNQWLLYAEEKDFEEFETRSKKHLKKDGRFYDHRDYMPRDPKRAVRKPSSHRDKWMAKEQDY